jgi:uncharacterized delta-60 repeat protein
MKKKLAFAALVFLFFSLVVPTRADTVPGSLDTGFDPGTGLDTDLMLNLSVRAMAVQPDGKVIIGGVFTEVDGIGYNYLARVNADGSLDTSFDIGTGANEFVFAVAVQPDGKIIVGGNFTEFNGVAHKRITRLNSDGSVDTSFNPGSGVLPETPLTTVYAVAIQSNGKILIGGNFTEVGGDTRQYVARLNTDGSVDSGFDTSTGANDTVRALDLQSDGKVVIGGEFTLIHSTAITGTARLNIDGSLDSSYSPVLGGTVPIVYSLTVQPDDKVIIGGSFTSVDGQTRYRTARLNNNGSVDSGFTTTNMTNDTVRSVALQSDGKVLIGGRFTIVDGISGTNRIARLDTDGSLDNSFNAYPGVHSGDVFSVVVQPHDDKVLIGGSFSKVSDKPRQGFARFLSDGSLDTVFYPGSGPDDRVRALAIQSSDGKVLIGGDFTSVGMETRRYIARLKSGGSLDSAFGEDNLSMGPNNTVEAIGIQNDGKVIIGGDFTSVDSTARNRIARLDTDGALDTSFNPGSGTDDNVKDVAILDDGYLIIAGEFSQVGGEPRNGIAKLDSSGTITSTFEVTGTHELIGDVYAIDILDSGKVLIGGKFILRTIAGSIVEYKNIARLNNDGTVDTSFSKDNWPDDDVYTLGVQPDGKIIIGGEFSVITAPASTSRKHIARLNADGSLDTSFDTSSGPDEMVTSVAIQSDGKILIGGEFAAVAGTAMKHLARLNLDGSLDTSYVSEDRPNNTVDAVELQADGKAVVGGKFVKVGNTARNRIARMNIDGTLDLDFSPGGGPNNLLHAIDIQSDDKILIGGQFTAVDGMSRLRIARLNANGALDMDFDTSNGPDSNVRAIALQDDGKVLIGGEFTKIEGSNRKYVARLNEDGSWESGFGSGMEPNNSIASIDLQDDGKVIIAGGFTQINSTGYLYVARLNTDGLVDTSFDTSAGPNNWLYAAAAYGSGKVVIGGGFTQVGGTSINRIARLNSDGSLDTSFDPGSGPNNWVYALAVQDDGKVLIGGAFNTVNGAARNHIARLNTDGSLDTTFDPKPAPEEDVHAIVVQSDSKILIAGNFDQLGSSNCAHIARLNADGSLDTRFDCSTGTNNNIYALGIQPDGKVIAGGLFTQSGGEERSYITRLNGATAPAFTSRSPAVATYNDSYSHTFTTSGYPYTTTLRLSSGELPPGLSFDPASGELSGIPTAIGIFNFSISASNWVAPNAIQQVDLSVKANTTISITNHTPSPSTVGEAVTVTYSVTAETGSPTGDVTVSDGTDSCTGTVTGGSCIMTLTTAGEKTLTAAYAGADTFHSSNSDGVPHTVNKADTTTQITGNSPDPSDLGAAIVVSYTVKSAGGSPTGQVTISDGTDSCTGTTAAGKCELTLSTAGNKNLTATYAGDTNFYPSTSESVPHAVNKAESTTIINSHTPDPSKVNTAFTVTFTVSTTIGTPTGDVTVSDGTDSCTGTLAVGSCELVSTTTGHKTLTATYAGDNNFNTSTSPGILHIVNLTGLKELHMPLMRR